MDFFEAWMLGAQKVEDLNDADVSVQKEVHGDAADQLAQEFGFNKDELNTFSKFIITDFLAEQEDMVEDYMTRAAIAGQQASALGFGIERPATMALITLVAYDFLRRGVVLGSIYTRENIREMNEALDVDPPDNPRTS